MLAGTRPLPTLLAAVWGGVLLLRASAGDMPGIPQASSPFFRNLALEGLGPEMPNAPGFCSALRPAIFQEGEKEAKAEDGGIAKKRESPFSKLQFESALFQAALEARFFREQGAYDPGRLGLEMLKGNPQSLMGLHLVRLGLSLREEFLQREYPARTGVWPGFDFSLEEPADR